MMSLVSLYENNIILITIYHHINPYKKSEILCVSQITQFYKMNVFFEGEIMQ